MPSRFDDFSDPLLVRLCAVGGMLMLVVLMASAALRLGQPDCIDTALPAMAVTVARMIHRIAALLVGVLVIAIAWRTWRQRLLSRAIAMPLAGLVAATVFLAVVGRASAGSTVPMVIVGNVVAGVILYVLFRYLQLRFEPRAPLHFSSRRLFRSAGAARTLAGVQIWLGAWVAGMAAGAQCAGVAGGTTWWPQLPPLAAFDPLLASAGAHGADAMGMVRLAHMGSAFVVLVLALPLALRMLGLGGRIRDNANCLLALLGIQAVLGIASMFAGVMPWSGIIHNVLAAVLLGLLVRIQADFQRA
jgi:heme a synthase